MLDIVVISGKDVCCSVKFGSLVGEGARVTGILVWRTGCRCGECGV